jgi:hypothetical protein
MNVRPSSPSRRSLAAVLAALALLAAAPVALAQPPPPADSVTVLARQRYTDGVKAYDAGRFEDARQAFLQAYALKHHPAVLLNLGQSELRSGHFEDAGNHLSQFLREYASATADERATADKGLAEATKKSGLVSISVDVAGADVSLDGVTVGKSPLPAPVFVKPGTHAVFATLQGRSAAASVDVKAGGTASAPLVIGGGAPPPVAPPVPVPVPVPPPVAPPEAPPPTPPPVAPPVAPPMVQPLPSPEPVVPPAQGESFGSWYGRKPLAWVGTGLAGLGLLGGIGFGAGAMSASSSSTSDASQISQHAAANHNPSDVCSPSVLSNPALNMVYATPCATLQTQISHYHTDVALMATSWVFFGVGVLGTALYAYLDWTPRGGAPTSASATPASAGPHASVAPILTPGLQGFVVTGSF